MRRNRCRRCTVADRNPKRPAGCTTRLVHDTPSNGCTTVIITSARRAWYCNKGCTTRLVTGAWRARAARHVHVYRGSCASRARSAHQVGPHGKRSSARTVHCWSTVHSHCTPCTVRAQCTSAANRTSLEESTWTRPPSRTQRKPACSRPRCHAARSYNVRMQLTIGKTTAYSHGGEYTGVTCLATTVAGGPVTAASPSSPIKKK